MKKSILFVALFASALSLFTACGQKSAESTAASSQAAISSTPTVQSESVASQAEAESIVLTPPESERLPIDKEYKFYAKTQGQEQTEFEDGDTILIDETTTFWDVEGTQAKTGAFYKFIELAPREGMQFLSDIKNGLDLGLDPLTLGAIFQSMNNDEETLIVSLYYKDDPTQTPHQHYYILKKNK